MEKINKRIPETIIKVKAHIDCLKDGFNDNLYEPMMGAIPYHYDDDVYEFEIVIRNIKDITEEVGVDDDGCRAFDTVEIRVEEDEN